MNDLSPKQRIFKMLESLAGIVNGGADLNSERDHLATLIDHSRSWETQVVDADSTNVPSVKNRQAIVDELHALQAEKQEIIDAASTVIDQKRLAIQHQCGEMGHVYGPEHPLYGNGVRLCVFCNAANPVAEEK